MQRKEILLLLPCHSLEDFPTHHVGDEADTLLSFWTAAWHPSLLVATGQTPPWLPIDQLDVPDVVERGATLLCPPMFADLLPSELLERVADTNLTLVAEPCDRDELVGALLAIHASGDVTVEEDLVADFFALGFAYLQIELQTLHMNYSSHLDIGQFKTDLVQAASAAVDGNSAAAIEGLRQCFSLLARERDHYFPVDAHVLDLALIAPTTAAPSIRCLLKTTTESCPVNVWMTGQTLQRLANETPALVEEISKAVTSPTESSPRWDLLGGEWAEIAPSLTTRESVMRNFRRGVDVFRSHLNSRPRTFFRRRFGLTGIMPDLLRSLEYVGAVHATLDAGHFPQCAQSRTAWQIGESHSVEAIGCIPLDASRPETFLQFASRMGQSMELDYVATVCLAHWAGTASRWYEDLRRTTRYGSILGKFTTAREYFSETTSNAQVDSFELDRYRAPWLRQAVESQQANPISTAVRRWRQNVALQRASTLNTWTAVVGTSADLESHRKRLQGELNAAFDRWTGGDPTSWPEDAEVAELLDRAAKQFSESLPELPGRRGHLLLNTASTNRRLECRLAVGDCPTEGDESRPDFVYAAGKVGGDMAVVADVPAMGFAWLPGEVNANRGQVGNARDEPASRENLVEGLTIRNEFLKAVIDESTGALQNLSDYRTRGNRLAQRLVRRASVAEGQGGLDSVMRSDRIDTVANSPTYGEILTQGRILAGHADDAPVLADFDQRFSLWRGSRVLRLSMSIRPRDFPTGKPWENYFACRWALPKGEFTLYRSIHGVRYETKAHRCESPEFFEIEESKRKTAILTAGLPYHHMSEERMLDSLLIVDGERCTDFDVGIAIDLPQPQVTAENWFAAPVIVSGRSSPPHPSGWLFHIDAKHVLVTGWEPILACDVGESSDQDGTGDVSDCLGFRVRLLETAGRSGEITLRSPKAVSAACKTNFLGKSESDLSTKNGSVQIGLGPAEWTEVECRW